MSVLRYVKTMEQVAKAAEGNPEFLDSRVRSIRLTYETDGPVARAVVPKPLEPAPRPDVCVTFSHVAIQITPDFGVDMLPYLPVMARILERKPLIVHGIIPPESIKQMIDSGASFVRLLGPKQE